MLLHVEDSTLDLSATEHDGVAEASQTVSLETAVVVVTFGPPGNGPSSPMSQPPQSYPAFRPGDPAWAQRTVRQQAWIRQAFTIPRSITMRHVDADIGPLTTSVPATAYSASLEMAAVPTTAGLPSCAEVRVSNLTCTPDVVRFWPAPGTPVDAYDRRNVRGAEDSGTGVAVPLDASPPPWLTDALILQACSYPITAPPDALPAPTWEGIRPGGWMVGGCLPEGAPDGGVPFGGVCTFDFAFRNVAQGQGARRAIGTSGHCFDGWDFAAGQKVLAFLRVQVALPVPHDELQIVAIGSPILVWRGSKRFPPRQPGDPTGSWDFALIEADVDFRQLVSPTTALVGGPCGLQQTDPGAGTLLEYVGQGAAVGFGTSGTARAGRLDQWSDFGNPELDWTGVVLPGDSGGPVQLAGGGPAAGLIDRNGFVPTRGSGNLMRSIVQDLLAVALPDWQMMMSGSC